MATFTTYKGTKCSKVGDRLPSSNLLEGAGDDKISMVHSNKISSKLTGEVILILELFPVNV